MAIQIPNPGTGNGATGDNEFVLWSKVKDNFSDQTNAASKIVGTGSGQIPMAQDSYKAAFSQPLRTTTGTDVNEMPVGEMLMYGTTAINTPVPGYAWIVRSILDYTGSFTGQFQIAHQYEGGTVYTRQKKKMEWTEWAKHYTSANTTKEAGTGYLVASSPVLKMQHDSFEKVHEAVQLDINIKHIKTGVYEITGTTGLRENDGWNLKPPKDVNGNVLCICEAAEKDGVVTLNTYAKRFDFETVSIVADYDKPLDIPEGATVMLRFNDLPLDDAQTEV